MNSAQARFLGHTREKPGKAPGMRGIDGATTPKARQVLHISERTLYSTRLLASLQEDTNPLSYEEADAILIRGALRLLCKDNHFLMSCLLSFIRLKSPSLRKTTEQPESQHRDRACHHNDTSTDAPAQIPNDHNPREPSYDLQLRHHSPRDPGPEKHPKREEAHLQARECLMS